MVRALRETIEVGEQTENYYKPCVRARQEKFTLSVSNFKRHPNPRFTPVTNWSDATRKITRSVRKVPRDNRVVFGVLTLETPIMFTKESYVATHVLMDSVSKNVELVVEKSAAHPGVITVSQYDDLLKELAVDHFVKRVVKISESIELSLSEEVRFVVQELDSAGGLTRIK